MSSDLSPAQAPAVVAELQRQGKDIVEGRRLIAYRQKVAMFTKEYNDAVGRKGKMEVLEKIVSKLREEGFRFLRGRKNGDGGWVEMQMQMQMQMEMDFPSICTKVRKLLLHFLKRKVNTPLSGPFMPPLDEKPSTNAILSGVSPREAFRHPANVVYRNKISDVAPKYKTASKEEKIDLTKQIIQDLQRECFHFVAKDLEGTWRELELSRVLEKVRHSLRDCNRDYKPRRGRKRKAAGEMARANPQEEAGHSNDLAECDQQEVDKEIDKTNGVDVHVASYVEDVAWKEFATGDPAVDKIPGLPPPGPLPPLLTEAEEQSCTWSFDKDNRILRATLKPGIKTLSLKAKEYLLLMMERDDIAVVTGGLCRSLERSLWNSHGITSTSGEMYHHHFRRFVRVDARDSTDSEVNRQSQYKEINEGVSMKVVDYFRYLEERRKLIESDGVKQGAERQMPYFNFVREKITLDLDEVVYMLDYDVKKKLPLHYQNFKDNFSFPEILPGGNMCAMKAVSSRMPRSSILLSLTCGIER